MLPFITILFTRKSDRRGVTAFEFALIASVVAAVMVVGASKLGTSLSTDFTLVASSV